MTDHRTTCLAAMDSAKKHKRILPPDRNWQADLLKAIEIWLKWSVFGLAVFVLIYNLLR